MTTRLRRLAEADQIVRATLKLIKYLAPRRWWLENPRFGLLRHRRFMRKFRYVDLDYCMFSDYGYRKPTRFWMSDEMAERLKDITCKGGCANMVDGDHGKRHRLQIGGRTKQRGTREEAYRIPPGVVDYPIKETKEPHEQTGEELAVAIEPISNCAKS